MTRNAQTIWTYPVEKGMQMQASTVMNSRIRCRTVMFRKIFFRESTTKTRAPGIVARRPMKT